MDDATPEATIARLSKDNERLRLELKIAGTDLHGVLVSMIADKTADVQERLEKTARRLARAVKT